MNKLEFETQMDRLKKEYGDAAYGPERTAAIFIAFQKWGHWSFKELVDRAFRSEKFAPLTKDLLRIAEEARQEEHAKKRIETKKMIEENLGPPASPEATRGIVARITADIKKRRPKFL